MTSLYQVLGVSTNATDQEIRSAYKRLALKYHPDKNGNSEEAKQSFMTIQEAYQILIDPDKKQQYDVLNNLNNAYSSQENSAYLMDIIHTLLQKLIQHWKDRKTTQPVPPRSNTTLPPDIHLNIEVSIDEIYTNSIKSIKIKVLRDNVMQSITLHVPLCDHKDPCVFENLGDNELSNIIVKINVHPHKYVFIDNVLDTYDVMMDIPITLYEYYYETKKIVPYLNGEELVLDIVASNKNTIVIPNKGLPYTVEDSQHADQLVVHRGKLYIFLKLCPTKVIPDSINNENTEFFFKQYFNDGTLNQTHI